MIGAALADALHRAGCCWRCWCCRYRSLRFSALLHRSRHNRAAVWNTVFDPVRAFAGQL
jgi:hypothetical protein